MSSTRATRPPVMPVKKAIFPVAGLGTRFLPATKAQPKEMLPVVDKPLIQYAVEEAYAAGVREMIFVTGRHKRPIEDHFDMTFELEVALEQANKHDLLEVVRSVKPDDCADPRRGRLVSAQLSAQPARRSTSSSNRGRQTRCRSKRRTTSSRAARRRGALADGLASTVASVSARPC